ncbi:iron complex outermembrane receptor protein [Tamilnaduibacter salinus]|uniref:Iron complex outermembrane receptor protein n=1 Tax=Tamilnaduibacter salinus TaxID=1484056 RepID=A0A2U1CZ91_9GAMM|nr:TonB-dependent receptor [Tamilnaduibacter salinus]PVY78115.1 iron complex outermembrane receptor protein [Tamilnaduibacter salinus]
MMKDCFPYTVTTSLLFAVTATHAATAPPDDPTDTLPPAPSSVAGTEGEFVMERPMPEVLSTARLRQPKSRVPGATTVIQGDLIRQLGVVDLWEIFRLVPGMTVGYVGSNKPVVSYHGTVAYDQRRLQVLIDGRTAYKPSLADVDWHAMPVALEDIQRIEISRGPNAAAYGINAFLGTINIITKSPDSAQGAHVNVGYGSDNHRDIYASVGAGRGDFQYHLSFQRRDDDGFDYEAEPPGPSDFHDSYRYQFASFDSVWWVTPSNSVEFWAGVTDGTDQEDKDIIGEEFGAITDPDTQVDDYYLQTKWTHEFSARHQVHVQVNYQRHKRLQSVRVEQCIDPSAPSGSQICDKPIEPPQFALRATTDQNRTESRAEYQIQDTYAFTPDTRLVSGGTYREDGYESDTFFNGGGRTYQGRLFFNLEHSPVSWLTVNSGGSLERTSVLDDTFFSPRVAANLQIARNQTLRFVYSRAVRTPDAFEQNADWGYRAHDVEPAALSSLEGTRLGPEHVSAGNLGEERIVSREISYFGQFRLGEGLLSTEVRFFDDDLRNLLSGTLNVDEWTLDNSVDLDQKGIELENSLEFRDSKFRLTYAYMDQDGRFVGDTGPGIDPQRTVEQESRLTAQHSGSLAWIQRYDFDISSAVTYYMTDRFRNGDYQRIDGRLSKTFRWPDQTVDVALLMQHQIHDSPPQSLNNNVRGRNQFFAEVGLRF